jgi:L-seryl-tRNA(Ser) seleniumtransferase
MTVYEQFGVRTIINVAGSSTRVGGALMPPEVVEAMSEAALSSVNLVELQAAASRLIAETTGAEAGYVTAGAASGLTLGAAAIMVGLDPGKIDRLPDTTGMKNEFIIAREHRNGYDHSVRLSGAKLVEVGMNERGAGAGARQVERWEYEAAITDNTAGIAYVATPTSRPRLNELVEVAHRHNLPVLVDAAAQLPPISNLKAFVETGADLVAFSGGKAIRGPQSTGILCGRRDLIASVALQHLDMDEQFDIWDPPSDFIPKDELVGLPRHGIGRGFKVTKEGVAGLLTALKLFAENRSGSPRDEQIGYLEYVVDGISGLPVDPTVRLPEGEGFPTLHLRLDVDELGASAQEICHELKLGSPGVFPNEEHLGDHTLVVNPMNLNQERTEMLTDRLRAVLSQRR